MTDRALEAAAEAVDVALVKVLNTTAGCRAWGEDERDELARRLGEPARVALLDSLLGDLPAEAVEAAAQARCTTDGGQHEQKDCPALSVYRGTAQKQLTAALRSLRGGLGGGA